MTPADSRIYPEYYFHDACLPAGLRPPTPPPTPPGSPAAGTDDGIAELERLAAAATAPPWVAEDGAVGQPGSRVTIADCTWPGSAEECSQVFADAAFIAAARTAVPALIGLLRTALAARQAAEGREAELREALANALKCWHTEAHWGDGIAEQHVATYDRCLALARPRDGSPEGRT